MFVERPLEIGSAGRRAEFFVTPTVAAPALQDFKLERPRGKDDTHIARLAVQRRERTSSGTRYFLALADRDGREDVGGSLRLVDLAFLQSGEEAGILARADSLSGRGLRNAATLRFPSRPPEDAVPLLAGFYFSKAGGGDHHMREVSVLPRVGGYQVTFRDDSPGDDRYDAQVNIVWVPSAVVGGRFERSFEDQVGAVDFPREPGQAALCGFSLRYVDTDRHIAKLEVALSGDRVRMSMRPNNFNRRIQGSVEYALLQTPE